jgi:hypothetical protein
VAIGAAVICAFQRKAAGLEKRLDYEMSDIRNIGNVRSGLEPGQEERADREDSLMSDVGDGSQTQEVGNPLKSQYTDLEIDESAI